MSVKNIEDIPIKAIPKKNPKFEGDEFNTNSSSEEVHKSTKAAKSK
jgi:hypothetical protein